MRIVVAVALGLATFGFAEDWPQWRGPHRDGSVQATTPWPNALRKTWTVVVGEGHSSPVVAGNRVFQFARQGEREVLTALDLETGKKLWDYGYSAPYEMNPAARSHGKGPKSTPAVAGGKLYTLGMTGVVTALDAATGKLLWRYDSAGKFRQTSPLYGVAASPLVEGDQVLVYLGTDDDGALTSIDAQAGKVRWQWKGDGPGYGSPIVVNSGGVRQVIVLSAENLVAVSVDAGRLLWKLPLTTPYSQNAVTALAVGSTVIYSGLQNPVFAIDVSNPAAPAKLWENRELGMYMSSPVLSGGIVYGLSHRNKGQYFALDPKSGKTLWTSAGRQTENALLAVRGKSVLALTTDGELHVFEATEKGLTPLRKHTVAQSATWAHPAFAGNGVLIKDFDSLSLWKGGNGGAPTSAASKP